jgi:hypothetical protein
MKRRKRRRTMRRKGVNRMTRRSKLMTTSFTSSMRTRLKTIRKKSR